METSTLDRRSCPVELWIATDGPGVAQLRHDSRMVRIRDRVYADALAWAGLSPWDRYLARVYAVALLRPDAIFCHESAAALLGMPVFGEPKDVHLFDVDAPTTHRVGDVVRHTSAVTPDVVHIDGIAMTAPAPTAIALARALPPAFGLAVVDAVISPRQLAASTIPHLHACLAPQIDPRGIRRVGWVLDHADAGAEAPSESVSRAVIDWLGFDPPELQRVFHVSGRIFRADFFWEGVGVVGEVDGDTKYSDEDHHSARQALLAEKRREDTLRQVTRTVARWSWSDVVRVDPLRRTLLRAGVPRVRAEHRGMLGTLRRNPRSLPRRD